MPPPYPVDAIAKLLNLTPRRIQKLVQLGSSRGPSGAGMTSFDAFGAT